MANGQIDPARLKGDALTRWYDRTPQEIQAEKDAAERKGLNAARKGITVLKKGSVSAGAAAAQMRKAGLATKGDEIHHTVAPNGTSRTAQDPRNHYALLKVLPKEQHRRLHGSWAGKPRYDPIRRVWYGTTDWQKAVPAGAVAYAADAIENLTQPFSSPTPDARKPGR
jgi:hypothetical protein